MEIDLKEKATMLAEAVDRPVAEIETELNEFIGAGYSPFGAVAQWKSLPRNKMMLGSGRQELIGRCISIEMARTVDTERGKQAVQNYHFAISEPESGEIVFKQGSVWSDRVDSFADAIALRGVYRFKAAFKPDGSLTRMSLPELIDEDLIADIDEIEPLPIEKITKAIGTNELVRGWIGRIINIGNSPVAFEVSDMSAAPPLTVWFSGQYSRIMPETQKEISTFGRGDEVAAFGWVSKSSNDMRMNARSVFRVGE